MRLLDPKENKDNKDDQTLRTIIRTQELQKVEQKARQDLANSQADFYATLAKQRTIWEKEEAEHRADIEKRKQEVNKLEAQRLNALIPVNILKQSAEEQLADAEEYVAKLRKREEYTEDLALKLQDKLDEVGGKEQDLKQKEIELNTREIGLENQSINTIEGSKRLSKEMTEFSVIKRQTETELENRVNALTVWEKSLQGQEEEVRRIQKLNNEQAIRSADERGVLQRAFDEVNRMKALYSNRK